MFRGLPQPSLEIRAALDAIAKADKAIADPATLRRSRQTHAKAKIAAEITLRMLGHTVSPTASAASASKAAEGRAKSSKAIDRASALMARDKANRVLADPSMPESVKLKAVRLKHAAELELMISDHQRSNAR